MEKNRTVTDIIGDEYQKWKPHDRVFISSPTGMGKTYFILNVLLPYVYERQKRILYLVNRRILKEQLETELSSYTFNLRDIIKVELYQTIEMKMSLSNIRYDSRNGIFQDFGHQSLSRERLDYDYVVCDECHYFLADSNYNTNTELSFRWIQETFSSRIRIFLSATIQDIKEYIISDDEKRQYYRTACYGFCGKNTIGTQIVCRGQKWEYETLRHYDYLDVHIINREDEISDLVINENGKWLIFVDNINFGKKLQTELIERWKQSGKNDESVIMLSSDYSENQESAQEVDVIRKDNRQSAKVLISTSVMDNGISLNDTQLRNIILFADTEVEFIQMLGRKRKDNEQVHLYIYKQSKVHFSNRLWKIKKISDIAETYFREAKRFIEEPLLRFSESGEQIRWDYWQEREWEFIIGRHKQIMQDMFMKKIEFSDVKSIFYVYNGVLYLNLLSFMQVEFLVQYYHSILDAFDSEGEDAFLKEQLRWLNKPDTEITDIISKSKISREEKCRKKLLDQFEKIKGTKMNKAEAIAFKKDVRANLLVLVQSVDENNGEKETVIKSLEKSDRPISKENMDFLKEFCDFPYKIEVERASNSGIDGKRDTTYVVRYFEE